MDKIKIKKKPSGISGGGTPKSPVGANKSSPKKSGWNAMKANKSKLIQEGKKLDQMNPNIGIKQPINQDIHANLPLNEPLKMGKLSHKPSPTISP